jgi:bacillithiol system protein YtxJ
MIDLININQLAEIDAISEQKPVIIFKHSTTCSISNTAFSRFKRAYANENEDQLPVFYLDLLKHRDVSNEIAKKYAVEHQSPQTLLISKGKSIHNASHFQIDLSEIKEAI